jgi:hypothetical protein
MLSSHNFRSTSPAREALLSVSTAPPGSPPRLAPSAGLVVVQASRWAMRIQRTKTMASKQPRKQTKSGAKADTGEANKPARDRQRAPRRRVSHTLLHGSAGLTSGPSSVEDHPSFRERDFAVAGQDYRRPVNRGERQIRLNSPRWEDATPFIVLQGCPPCRSRSMPIAVITSPGSRIG